MTVSMTLAVPGIVARQIITKRDYLVKHTEKPPGYMEFTTIEVPTVFSPRVTTGRLINRQ